ncbi:antiviral reverse transcriptase Drt4 [Leptospira ilyithenensis]|uniref:RNA-directed DNA polymerase n=1 Tax=Leptospira ilyithenensis TaxID=2484901 RepID=A0A4R9LMF6_9LEPT|nr:antiviral reverse transcriptase Drt4 [Leptospira ilyithenensis]TGN09658.1 RNA-directed DNA polymerase [Leptospira ilyithenensis]
MSVKRKFLVEALLKYNYFPFQKKKSEELPPIFSSSKLTIPCAEEISKEKIPNDRSKEGYDSVYCKATRFNSIPRLLSIPHPKPYIDLCFEFYNNWNKLTSICTNDHSIIIPRTHKDGRIIIMDYESSYQRRERYFKEAFGKKYEVHTDIANCFPSIYSHSIPWAIVGFEKAKKQRGDKFWFNSLDKKIQNCSRKETTGIPIGPATSNIIAEIILEKIDKALKRKYKYVRFIDDYTLYSKDETNAQNFIKDLGNELLKFKLNLNIKKTEIHKLPQPLNEEWIGRIKEILPKGKPVTSNQISDILDSAVRLQAKHLDGSVLKYTANALIKGLDNKSADAFVKYIIKLVYYYPNLLPSIKKPLELFPETRTKNLKKQIVLLLKESIAYGRTDIVCWLMYYLKYFNFQIDKRTANMLIEQKDCLPLTILFYSPEHRKEVVKFAKKIDKQYHYELDNYWILLYQIYLENLIENPYNDNVFPILKKNKISFVNIAK